MSSLRRSWGWKREWMHGDQVKTVFYQPHWGQIGGGQRYTGLAAQIIAEFGPVEFVHHCDDLDIGRIEEALDLDLSQAVFRHRTEQVREGVGAANPFRRFHEERNWYREISKGADLFINNSDSVPIISHAQPSILLTHFPLITYEGFTGRNTEQWSNRSLASRWVRKAFQSFEWNQRFESHDHFVVNSEYGTDLPATAQSPVAYRAVDTVEAPRLIAGDLQAVRLSVH